MHIGYEAHLYLFSIFNVIFRTFNWLTSDFKSDKREENSCCDLYWTLIFYTVYNWLGTDLCVIQQIKVSKLISLVKNISLYNFVLILERADQEAKNQFLEEIELMKAIGCHKNVVSMLGCCISSDPIFLVLEYAPYGDLQHWLRNKRLQVW